MLSDSEEPANTSDDLKDVYDRIEKQLTKQLEKCKAWRLTKIIPTFIQLKRKIQIDIFFLYH